MAEFPDAQRHVVDRTDFAAEAELTREPELPRRGLLRNEEIMEAATPRSHGRLGDGETAGDVEEHVVVAEREPAEPLEHGEQQARQWCWPTHPVRRSPFPQAKAAEQA